MVNICLSTWIWRNSFRGKRDLRTANKLRKRLKRLEITYDRIACDQWDSFLTAFKEDELLVGKEYTVGIEGNNCRLRHRLRRVFRKTCCFSKKLFNHWKAFSMTVFYINHGFVWASSYFLDHHQKSNGYFHGKKSPINEHQFIKKYHWICPMR